MNPALEHPLAAMTAQEILPVRTLIAQAMNEDEGAWAGTALQRHFELAQAGHSDGRRYFLRHSETAVIGVIGLHFYDWGPPENVWLGWFAVAPAFQGRGIGKGMLRAMERQAWHLGHRRMFIETYSSQWFARAREFYARQGFAAAGRIAGYLTDGADMIAYYKALSPPEG